MGACLDRFGQEPDDSSGGDRRRRRRRRCRSRCRAEPAARPPPRPPQAFRSGPVGQAWSAPRPRAAAGGRRRCVGCRPRRGPVNGRLRVWRAAAVTVAPLSPVSTAAAPTAWSLSSAPMIRLPGGAFTHLVECGGGASEHLGHGVSAGKTTPPSSTAPLPPSNNGKSRDTITTRAAVASGSAARPPPRPWSARPRQALTRLCPWPMAADRCLSRRVGHAASFRSVVDAAAVAS